MLHELGTRVWRYDRAKRGAVGLTPSLSLRGMINGIDELAITNLDGSITSIRFVFVLLIA